MRLKILLPFQVFADEDPVLQVIIETREGLFGLMPHRLDCAAALVPGILTYKTSPGTTVYLAVDEGVAVKKGADVVVSVRHAIGGVDLAQLHDQVKRSFLELDAQEVDMRAAIGRMQTSFERRLGELRHGR